MATTKKAPGTVLVRKLTIRTLVGGKPDILAAAMTGRANDKAKEGDPVAIMRVVGQVSGFKAGQSDYGDYIELRGNFHGTNLLTGEVQPNVSKAILPDVVGDAIAEALKGGAASAEFAVEIDVAYDEAAATMYVFSVRTLMAPAVAEPVQGIMARLAAAGIEMTAPLKLAAPKLSDADKEKQAAAGAAADKAKADRKEKATAKA